MCTVTFLPLGHQHFILTSNRDETTHRKPAQFPQNKSFLDKNIVYPKDGEAGGSWIAAADNRVVMCLLNGAFEKHKHQPPYRLSRGVMLLEAMECIRPEEFIKNFDFQEIEPFTLLMIYVDADLKLIEFRWDGQNKFIEVRDTSKPAIWSSSTLYTKEVRAKRENIFQQWLQKHPKPSAADIRAFHQQTDVIDDENTFKMKRPNTVETVSTTTVELRPHSLSMHYEDYTQPGMRTLTLSI